MNWVMVCYPAVIASAHWIFIRKIILKSRLFGSVVKSEYCLREWK